MIDKIRALLRKTTDRGASQAESEAAIEVAQKLMTKHGIDKMLVMSKEAEEASRNLEIVKQYHETGRQRYETDQYIARILNTCYSVKVLWSSSFEVVDSPTLKVVAYDEVTRHAKRDANGDPVLRPRRVMKKRLVYVLVGDKPDTEFAVMIIEELHPMMRRMFNAYNRENGVPWDSVRCHSFFEGLEHGFRSANKRGKEAALLEAGETAANQYALILVDKEKATEDFYSKIHTVRSRCVSGSRKGDFDSGAYKAGEAQGKKLKLGAKKLK